MHIKKYVPESVKTKVLSMLNGDKIEPLGWIAVLDKNEKELQLVKIKIQGNPSPKEDEAKELRKQQEYLNSTIYSLQRDVGALKRILTDFRMESVYTKLGGISDNEWRNFISAIWAANQYFSRYRKIAADSKALNKNIISAAEELFSLLDKTNETKYNLWPTEYFCIRELLRKTDNHEMNDHNLIMWQKMRKIVLADTKLNNKNQNGNLTKEYTSNTFRFIGVSPKEKTKTDQRDDLLNSLNYGWGLAPSFPAILQTLINTAKNFIPEEDGVVSAAIQSRKSNGKSEYLRAFIFQLKNEYKFTLTADLMNAIATTTNVILNDPNNSASLDDVKKIKLQLK